MHVRAAEADVHVWLGRLSLALLYRRQSLQVCRSQRTGGSGSGWEGLLEVTSCALFRCRVILLNARIFCPLDQRCALSCQVWHGEMTTRQCQQGDGRMTWKTWVPVGPPPPCEYVTRAGSLGLWLWVPHFQNGNYDPCNTDLLAGFHGL